MTDFASAIPRVAVLPEQEWPGLYRLADVAPAIDVVPLAEAFEREWATDAHFVTYLTEPYDAREPFFRINKDCLSEIRASGADVHVKLIALDWDTGRGAEHVPWTPEKWNVFREMIARVMLTPFGDRLKAAAFSYSTRKGWRWVWRLPKGVPADDAEPIIRGLIAEAAAVGMVVDDACADWTRLFRLPRVLREGAKTSADPFFVCDPPRLDVTIDPKSITPVGKPAPLTTALDASQPEQEEAHRLLHLVGEKGQPETAFYKAMKKAMPGTPYFGCLFERGGFQAPEGKRHDILRAWTMSAAGYVVRHEGATVQHLYALFLSLAEQLHEQEKQTGGSRNWLGESWKLCAGAWKKVSAEFEEKKQQEIAEKQAEAKAEVEGAESITRGVRAWFPGLPEDPIQSWDWIRGRMILKAPKGRYFVMRPDGRYSAIPADSAEGIVPRIKDLKMEPHIPIYRETKAGPRPVKREELLADFARTVTKLDFACEISGGYISKPEEDEKITLIVPSFRRRTDLVPEFNPDCDLWLRALAGTGGVWGFVNGVRPATPAHLLNIHLAKLLAFDLGAVAAMSFNLEPGSGKKMLAHALLECMEEAQHATGEDLVQRFNWKLAVAAFLFVNEGLPESQWMYHASDTIRRIITGDFFQAERKGQDAINVKFPIRAILTANHWRLIDALGEGRDLAPHERAALGLRLVHYDAGAAPAELLKAKGGHAWTAGWIAGDSGEPSRFVLAKHLLWLWQEYGRTPMVKGRLLVEGDPDQPAIQRLRILGGSTPIVIEALVKFLDSSMVAEDGRMGLLIKGSRLFVTVGAILDHWRQNLTKGSSERLTAKRISMSLKGLIVGDQRPKSIDGEKERWNEIDVVILAAAAEKYGWNCPRIEKLLAARIQSVVGDGNGNGHSNGNGNGNGVAHAPPSILPPVIS